MEIVKKGFVHYVDQRLIIRSYKGEIYISKNEGNSWEKIINLADGLKDNAKLQSKLLRRLSRHYIYHIIPANENWAVFGLKKFFLTDLDQKEVIFESSLTCKRPLKVSSDLNGVYYGDYQNNKNRHPVHLFFYSTKENKWQPIWRFKNIRHIHGVHVDPFEDAIWVTTGDNNEEAAIWRTKDNFKSIEKIAGNSQQLRTITLIFTEENVFFGSDTPEEKNHIYKLNRRDNSIKKLAGVKGSVFHGCKINNWLFFSTAVEPSRVNTHNYAEIWASPNGNEWKKILDFKKDWWNKKYFQYGQVSFPEGPGDGKNLWMTPFATKNDQKILKIRLEEVKSLFQAI